MIVDRIDSRPCWDGGADIILHTDDLSGAKTLMENYIEGKKYIAEIKEKRPKRSLDANAYCFVLIGKLAKVLRIPKEDIYREAIKGIGGNSEIICIQDKAVDAFRKGWERNGLGWVTETMPSRIEGCTNVIVYYGSSTYDSKQMSVLIDHIIADCKEHGIETMTPRELAQLKEKWGG